MYTYVCMYDVCIYEYIKEYIEIIHIQIYPIKVIQFHQITPTRSNSNVRTMPVNRDCFINFAYGVTMKMKKINFIFLYFSSPSAPHLFCSFFKSLSCKDYLSTSGFASNAHCLE